MKQLNERFITTGELAIYGLQAKIDLQQLINEFMNMPDVISGKAFSISPKNTPNGWYEAISTTGYCVKVSEVFKERMLDNHKHFYDSEILSISIDPNKYGKCGDGSKNAWHTCVDLRNGYVVDLTIAQFGAKYNNHFIWWKTDWLKEFQSLQDTHDVGYTPDPENIRSISSPFTTLVESLNSHFDKS